MFFAVLPTIIFSRMWDASRFNPQYCAGYHRQHSSWVVLLTGLFDAVENYALLDMIEHGASETMAKTAGGFAGAKFVLLFLALVYILTEAALQGFEQRS